MNKDLVWRLRIDWGTAQYEKISKESSERVICVDSNVDDYVADRLFADIDPTSEDAGNMLRKLQSRLSRDLKTQGSCAVEGNNFRVEYSSSAVQRMLVYLGRKDFRERENDNNK